LPDKLSREEAVRILIQAGELPTEEKINELIKERDMSFKPADSIHKPPISLPLMEKEPENVVLTKRKVDDIEPNVKIKNRLHYTPHKINVKDFAEV